MLLTADVGNTNIKLGIYENDRLNFKLRFSTDPGKTSDELAVELYTFFQIYAIDTAYIKASIISSVVPKVTQPLREAIEPLEELKKDIEGNLTSVEKDFKNIGKPKKEPAKKETAKEAPAEEQTVEAAPKKTEAAPAEPVEKESVPEAADIPAAEDKQEEPISETEGGVNE